MLHSDTGQNQQDLGEILKAIGEARTISTYDIKTLPKQ